MRKFLIVFSCLIFTAATYSCATSQKAASDEGYVRTFASDKRIMSTILKRFLADDLVKDLNITPRCYNGDTYLVGEYETEKQKNRAIEIASSVDNVKSLNTYLLPKKREESCTPEKNLGITAQIKDKITGDRSIWSKNVSVVSVQCNVVLLGVVGTDDEIKKAIDYTKSIEGVRSVESYLKSVK
jgi:hyperosmotically inducible protein